MSNRLRALMQMRQEAARAARPVDLDDYRASIQQQIADAIEQDKLSPVPLGKERIIKAYSSLIGPSIASQIVQQYTNAVERSIQSDMANGDKSGLMRPMISSVVQLDR